MYKICQTEQSSRRQEQIKDTFLSMLAFQNYEEITISALCAEARIPRKTFYRYFDSKRDIFLLAIDLLMIEFETWNNAYTSRFRPQTTEKEIEKIICFFLEKKQFFDIVKQNHLSILFFQRVLDQAISEHINLRFVCSDSTTKQQRLSMIFSVTGLLSLLWDWHQGGCKESPGELARMITPMLTVPPLMPAPGRITCDYADSPPAGSDIL